MAKIWLMLYVNEPILELNFKLQSKVQSRTNTAKINRQTFFIEKAIYDHSFIVQIIQLQRIYNHFHHQFTR